MSNKKRIQLIIIISTATFILSLLFTFLGGTIKIVISRDNESLKREIIGAAIMALDILLFISVMLLLRKNKNEFDWRIVFHIVIIFVVGAITVAISMPGSHSLMRLWHILALTFLSTFGSIEFIGLFILLK